MQVSTNFLTSPQISIPGSFGILQQFTLFFSHGYFCPSALVYQGGPRATCAFYSFIRAESGTTARGGNSSDGPGSKDLCQKGGYLLPRPDGSRLPHPPPRLVPKLGLF